jgi:hypothetical protein
VIRDKILARDVALLLDQARDLEELSAILRRNAPAFRFVDLDVCLDADPLPPLSALTTPNGNHWRLEYPIATRRARANYLVITCPIDKTRDIANPERVARILAPAIARWMETRAHAELPVALPTAVAPTRVRRDSGGWHSSGSKERTRV